MLDFGSGPGTAVLAAKEVFGGNATGSDGGDKKGKTHTKANPGAGGALALAASAPSSGGLRGDIVCVEQSASMTQVAEHLLADTPGVMFRRSLADVSRLHKGKRFDLIVAHYTLSELCSDRDREWTAAVAASVHCAAHVCTHSCPLPVI